jgi:hypothetical protein
VNKKLIAGLTAVGLTIALTAGSCEESDAQKRRNAQQSAASTGETLEQKNLKEKKRREENPNAVGYVYLVSFGKPMGYYVTKGKISSNGSQLGPEDEAMRPCSGCDHVVLDSAQDDGSYGQGDPGIFFFTAEGVKVVTSLDYIQSDSPIPFNVPKLNGSAG